MTAENVAPLIVAFTGLVATAAGIFATVRGRKDTRTDAAAAARVAERVQGWTELRELVDLLRDEVDRKDAAIERLVAERDRERARADAAERRPRDRRP